MCVGSYPSAEKQCVYILQPQPTGQYNFKEIIKKELETIYLGINYLF